MPTKAISAISAIFKPARRTGRLPAYTFLEPSFGASGNSQHPNYDVALGEQADSRYLLCA